MRVLSYIFLLAASSFAVSTGDVLGGPQQTRPAFSILRTTARSATFTFSTTVPLTPPPLIRATAPPSEPQKPRSVLTLADGAEAIAGPIQDTFTCQDKIYGYYADVDNGCKIFHVCVPIQDENGQQTAPSLRFSFFCNNGTVFNQAVLVCDHEDKVDCSSAPNFYNINEKFGKIEPRSGPAA